MIKSVLAGTIACCILIALAFMPAWVAAQDPTAEPTNEAVGATAEAVEGTITPNTGEQPLGTLISCDSTLILLLYLAEAHFGFESMTLDVALFEKGQYTPWFGEINMLDNGMNMPEPGMDATEEMMVTEEPEMDATEEMTATEESGMMATEPPDSVGVMPITLVPGNIPGEDISCTQLRTELETFFVSHYNMMMMEGQ